MDPRGPARERALVHLALLVVSLLFGFGYVGGKILLGHFSPATWALTRAASALAVLLLLAGPRLARGVLRGGTVLRFGLLALFGIALNQIAFIEGLARTIPPHSAVINTGIPVFTLLIAWASGRERLWPGRLAGVLLSLAGVAFLLEVDRLGVSSRYLAGDLLTLANALSFSVFLVLSRGVVREASAVEGTLLLYLWGTAFIALWALPGFDAGAFRGLTTDLVLVALVMILGVTILTYVLNTWALARVDSSVVAVYVSLQPVVAALFSRALLGTPLTPRLYGAAAATAAGVWIASRARGGEHPRSAERLPGGR